MGTRRRYDVVFSSFVADGFRRISDVAARSMIDRKWEYILTNLRSRSDVADWSKMTKEYFDESATSLRRRCDVIDWSKMTNKFRRICDIAIWSKMANQFRRICKVIGRKWPIDFDESATSQWRRRLVENDQQISTNLRRRCNVTNWSKMTNRFWQICNVAALSQFGRKWPINFYESATSLWRRCDVIDWSKMTNKFRRICDVAATSQFGRKWSMNFDESAKSLVENDQ